MAGHSPLLRWKRFFPTFDAIHGAIEACDPAVLAKDELGLARVYQSAKAEVVEFLCDYPWNGEDYCMILDELMIEYLVTLKTVPVTPGVLASTDLAKAVGVLQEHESEKIRSLASEIILQWSNSVEINLSEARSRVEELRKLSDQYLAPNNPTSVVGHAVDRHASVAAEDDEKKTQVKDTRSSTKAACPVRGNRVELTKREEPAKISTPLPKKTAPVVGSTAIMDKMEATKRKLREGYQEAADAKRQRKIIVIETPKMAEQRQGKMHAVTREGSQAKRATSTASPKVVQKQQRKIHPIIWERNQARCAVSTAVRRSLMPSFCRV